MKPFEEILAYHTEYSVAELNERQTEPLLQFYDVLLAKKEWDTQVKNCSVPAVVGQSEQLNAFMDYCNKIEPVWAEEFRAWIEDYLEGI